MPSDTQYLVHTRLTRRDHRGDVIDVTGRDNVAFAVTSWRQEHPDVHVGELTVITEAAGLPASFVTWLTEAPAHVHEQDDDASLPGALTADQLAALVPGSPIEFLVEGTWYPGEVRVLDVADPHGAPMLIVSYAGERAANPKILKGSIKPGDGFHVYTGEVRPIGGTTEAVSPPRPTIHVVRDALVRVVSAAPDTHDASDRYSLKIDGVQILVRLVTEDSDTKEEPSLEESTVYVHVENAGHAKGTTRLVVDVNGNASTYRL
ncbi:hypothetical protein [Frankia gtarii]|uniref:hypothetical protein n=1 Tax=Frankia gtarii TaxID=2950102 RepID=UPI0021C1AF03|nr:hypothetical protein [Frankia gtarii]